MFSRWRLPADDYPDDTETSAFRNYTEGGSRPAWQLPLDWQQWALYGAIGLLVLGLGLGSLYVYHFAFDNADSNASDQLAPLPTPVQLVMLGDFPGNVPQIYVNVPARVDDMLPAGQARGYTFLSDPGITWNIQVAATGEEGFAPRITLYGNGGEFLATAEGNAGGTALLSHFVAEAGLFAVLFEGVDASGGSYTIRILPADL